MGAENVWTDSSMDIYFNKDIQEENKPKVL